VDNMEDDNVLFQNMMQMADALEQSGRIFEQVIYTEKTHGVTGPVRKQMLTTMLDFFEKNLK
jgi:dipeptidyl-peptidase 4